MRLFIVPLLLILPLGGQSTTKRRSPPVSGRAAERPFITELRGKAMQGQAKAQFDLGVSYRFGQGVPQSCSEAVKWYRKAAEQGYTKAQFNLGVCCDTGKGVPQDHAEAVRWYRKAAEQGYAKAQFNLGVSYKYGQGVAKDSVEAYAWLSLAAARGEMIAFRSREEVIAGLTSQERERGQARARQLSAEVQATKARHNQTKVGRHGSLRHIAPWLPERPGDRVRGA